MSKMLDILEVAFSLYNFTYVRLDGATKTEFRQPLVEYFNSNPKLFLFISLEPRHRPTGAGTPSSLRTGVTASDRPET